MEIFTLGSIVAVFGAMALAGADKDCINTQNKDESEIETVPSKL